MNEVAYLIARFVAMIRQFRSLGVVEKGAIIFHAAPIVQ